MNKIKKLFGYAILATLVTIGSLDAQTCVKPVNPTATAIASWAAGMGALTLTMDSERINGPAVVLGVASLSLAGRTLGANLDLRAYDNCLAWEAYHAAQAEDQRRAAEIRRRSEEMTRLHLIRMDSLRAVTDSVSLATGVPRLR